MHDLLALCTSYTKFVRCHGISVFAEYRDGFVVGHRGSIRVARFFKPTQTFSSAPVIVQLARARAAICRSASLTQLHVSADLI